MLSDNSTPEVLNNAVQSEVLPDKTAESGEEAKAEVIKSEAENMPKVQTPVENDLTETLPKELTEEKTIVMSEPSIEPELGKIFNELHEMRRLYHNEFAGRLRKLEEELGRYHEIDKGRAFDDILRALAGVYRDHELVLESIADENLRKRVSYIFMDLLDILETYGVYRQKSQKGDKRNVRFCHIENRIETENPELHDTVAASLNSGFYIDKRALIPERVDIYVLKK